MPEGPELRLASRFINSVCKERIFGGKVIKSEIHKCPPVNWECDSYSISATSRGKEIKVTLTENVDPAAQSTPKTQALICTFGLVGRFRFDPVDEIQKHAHLNFYTKDKKNVLSFVDYMRFGTWKLNDKWGADRGPCVISEYQSFRENVLKNLNSSVFNKPICEAMLNQKYFNGIGNYLRAEALFRASIKPFECARSVLEGLGPESDPSGPDLLELCHKLPVEVVNLSDKSGYDAADDTEESSAFSRWLQCYYNPEMNNLADHNKRTIWFSGPAGPLAPINAVKRHQKGKQKKKTSKAAFVNGAQEASDEDDPVVPGAVHMSTDHDYTPKTKTKMKRSSTTDKRRTATKRTNAHDFPTSPRKLRSTSRKNVQEKTEEPPTEKVAVTKSKKDSEKKCKIKIDNDI